MVHVRKRWITYMKHYVAYVKMCIEVCDKFTAESSFEDFSKFRRCHDILEHLNVRLLSTLSAHDLKQIELCKFVISTYMNKCDLLEFEIEDITTALRYLKDVRRFSNACYLISPQFNYDYNPYPFDEFVQKMSDYDEL